MKKRIWPLYFGGRKFEAISILVFYDFVLPILMLVTKSIGDKNFAGFISFVVNVVLFLVGIIMSIIYHFTVAKYYNKDDPEHNDDILGHKIVGVLLAVFIFEMYVLVIRPQCGPLIKFPWQR